MMGCCGYSSPFGARQSWGLRSRAPGKNPYPVTLEEMPVNVRSFEAVHRSVKSEAIEAI
jgi:hypothetical protein